MGFAEERLAETKELVEAGNTDFVFSLMKDYKTYIEDLQIETIKAKEEGKNVSGIVELIATKTSDHPKTLKGLKEIVPKEIRPIIKITSDTLEERQKSIVELIPIEKQITIKKAAGMPFCGNGLCDIGETKVNCPEDCHCGDGICDPCETSLSCLADCIEPFCGDLVCSSDESFQTCWIDCGCPGSQVCYREKCRAITCFSDVDCDDSDPCTIDTCTDGSCIYTAITACIDDDGCCPSNCNSTNDNDCEAVCGNGICEPGENCSNCLADCPCKVGETCVEGECQIIVITCLSDLDCDDANVCTIDTCQSPGTPEASCTHTMITSCINDDGCCPSGCNVLHDNDCQAVCGNGVCETGENYENCDDCPLPQCMDGIDKDGDGKIDYPDDPGCSGLSDDDENDEIACYFDADCEDEDPCTIWYCENPGNEDAYCFLYATITACINDDGCCPPGCTFIDDNDCLP